MLVTRTIAGILKDADGNVFRNQRIAFTPAAIFGDDGVLVPMNVVTTSSDNNGNYSIDLYTLDTPDSYIRYTCELPGSQSFVFDLIDGAPTSLDELFNTGAATGTPSAQAALAALLGGPMQASLDIRRQYVAFHDLGPVRIGSVDGGFVVDQSQTGMWTAIVVDDYSPYEGAFGLAVLSLLTESNNFAFVAQVNTGVATKFGPLGRGIVKTRFRFAQLINSTAGNNYTYRIGLMDQAAATPLQGCFFLYNHAVNGGRWQAVCLLDGSEITADTGVAPVIGAMTTYRVEIDVLGLLARFYINDVLVATLANVPNLPYQPVGATMSMIRSAGTTPVSISVWDYAWAEWNLTTPRDE